MIFLHFPFIFLNLLAFEFLVYMFYCVFSILPVCTYSVYISPLFCNPASNILNCFCFWVHILPSYFLFDFFLSKVIMGLFTFFAILL